MDIEKNYEPQAVQNTKEAQNTEINNEKTTSSGEQVPNPAIYPPIVDTAAPTVANVGEPLPAGPPLREPLNVTRADSWFALVSLVLGYLFIRWGVQFAGTSSTIFVLVFAAAVLIYARTKGVTPAKASWFWLAVLLLSGIGCSFWVGGAVYGWRALIIFASAVYWCASLTGGLIEKKTGNYVLLDGINLLLLVPFRNFGALLKCLMGFAGKDKEKKNRRKIWNMVLYIAIGVLASLPVLALVLPLLLEADQGGFTSLLQWLNDALRKLFTEYFWNEAIQVLLSIPVSFYICGLVVGLVHKRYSNNINKINVQKTGILLRISPIMTSVTALALICLLYIVFVGSQLPYFFSAFIGQRPDGYAVYSAYARDGFFELCRIAAINLGLIAIAWGISKRNRQESKLLMGLSIVLSVVTLLLITTAFSKMALYIGAYGLTIRRVLACLFLLFLAIMFGGIVALQFLQFSIMRLAAVCGAVILCALSLVNVEGLIARYNAGRYLAGTLEYDDYNYSYLSWNGGYLAFDAALEVAEKTTDKYLRKDILYALENTQKDAANTLKNNAHNTCLELVWITNTDIPEE